MIVDVCRWKRGGTHRTTDHVENILMPTKPASQWWLNFFNASEDPQIVCRTDGVAEHINPKAAARFRLDPPADEGVFSVFELFAVSTNRKLGQLLKKENAGAERFYSVVTHHRNVPYALMDLEFIPLDGGYGLIVFKDSSRRLRLEAHVQRLVTAVDATPDHFLVTDADLRITYVNPAFQSATGYCLEEVLGRSDEFLRAPSESEKVNTYRDLASQGREWFGELVNQRRNGELYHVECTVSPIADIADRFMGYVVCERDITLRLQLQGALRAERDFVHSILHSLDGAIYSLDCEFRLTHANAGWRHLPALHAGIQFDGAPVMGRSLLDQVPDATRRGELRLAFEEVIATGRSQENLYHAPDGRHWLMRISPWIDGPNIRGLICNVADQTHFHELQNQLFQAQKMEIIGTLAAGVAHDFNNLLQAIRGHAGLILLDTKAGSPLHHGLEKIDLAAARAAEIARQLLTFSRMSDDRRTVLDLNQVIKETALLARRTLRGNMTLELHPAAQPVNVRMDSTRASQALLNLCVNAQDAMPAGGKLTLTNAIVEPSAELVVRHSLTPGAVYARCSVADTGCGIAPETLPKIFQPFFTTKENGKGTGLGLPIVQRVAQEAGGFIEVESLLGQGSTFHLYLPLVREPSTPVAAPNHAPLAQGTGCVLFVDDVDLLRDLARTFLEMSGLTVLVASNGPQALKIMEESTTPVNLIFTDYNMPGMNGVELMEKIAANWPETKFILASGYLDDATRDRAERCTATVLAKPYEMHEASEAVMKKLAVK
jgi:two-component system cell cycle sensor histidine kinase/response regulator CckA